jgi:acyl-CoA thioesterase I
MKIVFFGDSLTQGSFGVSYVDKLAGLMRGHHFINTGVNGDTSLNLYRRVDQDVLALKPDGVFVMIGVNDATSHAELGANAYYRYIKRIPGGKISPISFRENLRALLTKIQVAKVRAWVALPPVEYRPVLVDAVRQMNAEAAKLCAEMQIPVLDLMAYLTPKDIPERQPFGLWTYQQNLFTLLGGRRYDQLRDAGGFTYTFDGIHLTDSGAQRIAELIANFLRVNGVPG